MGEGPLSQPDDFTPSQRPEDRQDRRAEEENEGAGHGPVIRDKRRIDPETGELRHPTMAAESSNDSTE